MKKIIKATSLVMVVSIMLASCSQKKRENLPGISQTLVDSASYAIGVSLGSMVQQAQFGDLNMGQVYQGIEDILDEKSLKIESGFVNQVINDYMVKRQEALSAYNAQVESEFLEKNKLEEGVVALVSGLQYKVLVEGNGVTPSPQDTVEVHYIGSLVDGTQFDSSHDRGETATLALNQFIPGWVEGMQYVSEGGKIQLFIPSSLAYGNQQLGIIKPGSTLIFEVDLISVKKAVEESN